ncbi:hypothetical protein [Spirosoma panaciterrae]|uniref:hypothetical protein n=1 Tax=Spirosoma panaciterrae TaxID=496058 RepID=UPI00035DB5E1|nr:hypothetical protein [Spirosoma panaciterrae]
MPKTGVIQDPILVKNPSTGRHINIAPLFDTIEAAGETPEGSVAGLKHLVARIIRRVNLSWDGDATDQKNVNYDLYLLHDMFEAMAEFNRN